MTSPTSVPESAAPGASADARTDVRSAHGDGLATITDDGVVLDVWYPAPALGPRTDQEPKADVAALAALAAEGADPDRGVTRAVVHTDVDLTVAPADTADAWLRLHLLSHRLVQPNASNLDGIFGKLTNVVWTNHGPCSVAGFETVRAKLMRRGPVTVYGVDKFPRMVDYVLPHGVRIADADRVRLGAHLADGTTVMHEGFVNYNAGTLGHAMVEGRISAGVVVGRDSDVGGGASIMGTLSGGGKERVRIGERVLLGANSGVGISIGDDSVVEAGLYVTAGTLVRLAADGDGRVVKAAELSGVANLLFRRHSTTGEVQALPRDGRSAVSLNADLHAN